MCSAAQTKSARDLILATALRLFGEHGIEATSLREVAKAADVSPALVVHHFAGKEGLLAAVDEAALRQFGAAYSAVEPTADVDLLRLRAEQTAQEMREHPESCAYLGRALVEGTAGSARLFRLMIDAGRAEIDVLIENGAVRDDTDRLWATLQHFFLIWAPLSFMPLLQREALGCSLLEEATLNRWVSANAELLEGGLYR